MKLVTFNIRCDYDQDGINSFKYRKPLIVKKIKEEDPDIICFQEVLPHVAVWLKETLQDYYVIGCGRDENLEDEQNSIAYKKTKFNLMGMEVFWLSETPTVPGSRYENQSVCPRICTQALFQDMGTKEIFRIYNTHLDHIGSKARKLGLGQILEDYEQMEALTRIPTIITGDFNAFPDSPEMELLAKYPRLIDLTTTIDGTFHDYGQLDVLEKIDYIIASDNYHCSSVKVWDDCENGIYLSDHYPVSVEISTR
ncbi:MAG: endonuclease/exonuclease/phosphatase family protein [Clostridiales bacterium]|nr:endonuclease/exonuclease/phosphatase family protein [Clostridiales bacterium]